MTICIEIVQLYIPWITYAVFLVIAIVNSKNLINWVLLVLTLILLSWHISADLVTKKSHQRLTRGWGFFTLIAALLFLVLIIFQICAIDQVYNMKEVQSFIKWLPEIIVKNRKIIGLVDYTEFTKFELGVKFLAYVAYFNLSIITKRQLERSAAKVKAYERRQLKPIESLGSDSSFDEGNEVMEVGFSLVFVVYKLKILWPIFDIISWHTSTILAMSIVFLAVHWKLSVATLLYVAILMIYYILIPFFLQPNPEKSGKKFKESLSQKELSKMWDNENSYAKKVIIGLRNNLVVFITFFTIIYISILHLSANLATMEE